MEWQWYPISVGGNAYTSKEVPHLSEMARAVPSPDRFCGMLSAGVLAAYHLAWFYSLPRDPVSFPTPST